MSVLYAGMQRTCTPCVIDRIKQAEKQYLDAFNDELESFKVRVKERAEIRLENARKEVEEEERQQRLGPGGLDPIEVMESLPKVGETEHSCHVDFIRRCQ